MNKRCILLLSILVIGCYSVPLQRRRRQPETATEVLEEAELSLEKLELDESTESDNKDKQEPADEVAEPDKEKAAKEKKDDDKKNNPVEPKEPVKVAKETPKIEETIEESKESAELEKLSDDEDEVVEPKGVEELYQESKAEFEKNDKKAGEEPTSDEAEKGSLASDSIESDDELQSAVGDVAPAAGGMFSMFSQMWQTVSNVGSSWEQMRRWFNAFAALAGFQ